MTEKSQQTRQHFARHLMQQLASFGIGDAPAEARAIADHLFSQHASTSALHAHKDVPPALKTAADIILSKRQTGEPLAYILGEAYFYGRPFHVKSGVLIPRHDSETLIEAVRTAYPDPTTPLYIIDIGVGSGILALTLLLEYPNATAHGNDTEQIPLDVTAQNAARYNLSHRITLTHCANLPANLTKPQGSIPIVISNPPYIAADDPALDANTAAEPNSALIAANNGLAVYEKIIPAAQQWLPKKTSAPNIFLEIGHKQAADVTDILHSSGFHGIVLKKDIAERPRTLCAIA